MTPPSLPQEIIDNIIDEFEPVRREKDRTPNKRTLASLSIVARAWRGRSQQHLFSVIDFKPFAVDVTEADLDELGPVFSLTRDLEISGRWQAFSRFDFVTTAFLRCFRNLETLSLTEWDSWRHTTDQFSTCFGHFGETVTDLKLGGDASSESLIFLTSMFPRLDALWVLTDFYWGEEPTEIIPKEEFPTTGSFQGYLYLSGLSEHHNNFLAFLASTSPRFDTICTYNCEPGDGVENLLNSSATTLESLNFNLDMDYPGMIPTSLSKCTQLREVSVSHPWRESAASLLLTIRSPHLEKVVIYPRLHSPGKLFRAEDIDVWTRTDGELCEAYDQWAKHATGKIEVVFEKFFSVSDMDEDRYSSEEYQEQLKRFLPRSIEKVAVSVEY